jgi:hypothetical protein
MAYTFTLPSDTPANKKQVEDIFQYLVSKGKSRRNPQSIRWWIANYYMRGIRNFSGIDYTNGTVQVAYQNEEGNLKFQFEDVVSKYQAQLGRLLSLDLSPSITRRGISLDGLRKASVAQVVLDSAFPEDKVKELALNICPSLLMYGTVGAALWVDSEDSMGIDVIMPWEILPIPVDIASPTDARGLIRTRIVPTDWIKSLKITPGAGTKTFKNLDSVRLPVADIPPDLAGRFDGQAQMASTGGGFFIRNGEAETTYGGMPKKSEEEDTYMDVTQLTEVWLQTGDGYLSEYLGFAGTHKFQQLFRINHEGSKNPMPIRIIRDTIVGGFWGRSYVDMLIPLNNEIEYALSSVFQGISDFDLYGLQLWPSTLGTPPEAQRGQDGIKRIVYEPDYTCPDMKPENVMPAKMTQPQVQAVKLAMEMMDRLANQPADLMRGDAPGRVDSSAGLGLLYETSSIPLSPTAKNLANGLSGVYRSMLRVLKDMWNDLKVVSISNLDDSLAGIVIDAEAGTLSLSQNAIPYPDEVNVGIKSETPISKEQQKAELKESLKEQRITLDEFNIAVRKLGLNIEVGGEIEWQNYRRAMLENIVLFKDGKTPGTVDVSERDMHMVHKKVLDAFMARPEFFAASVEVQDAFEEHWQEHQINLGILPEGMLPPDEAAEMEMGDLGELGMMGPGGGGLPQ